MAYVRLPGRAGALVVGLVIAAASSAAARADCMAVSGGHDASGHTIPVWHCSSGGGGSAGGYNSGGGAAAAFGAAGAILGILAEASRQAEIEAANEAAAQAAWERNLAIRNAEATFERARAAFNAGRYAAAATGFDNAAGLYAGLGDGQIWNISNGNASAARQRLAAEQEAKRAADRIADQNKKNGQQAKDALAAGSANNNVYPLNGVNPFGDGPAILVAARDVGPHEDFGSDDNVYQDWTKPRVNPFGPKDTSLRDSLRAKLKAQEARLREKEEERDRDAGALVDSTTQRCVGNQCVDKDSPGYTVAPGAEGKPMFGDELEAEDAAEAAARNAAPDDYHGAPKGADGQLDMSKAFDVGVPDKGSFANDVFSNDITGGAVPSRR